MVKNDVHTLLLCLELTLLIRNLATNYSGADTDMCLTRKMGDFHLKDAAPSILWYIAQK